MTKRAGSPFLSSIALFIILAFSSVAGFLYGTPTNSATVTLAVHILPTADGGSGSGLFADRYPKIIEVKDVAAFADHIAAYGVAYHVWIAPKGCTGSAVVGADGSTVVKLYPVNGSAESGPRFRYDDTGGCAGCALDEAAPYFPRAMQAWKKSDGSLGPADTLPRGLKLIPISSTLAMYTLPSRENLAGRGAAYFIPSNEYFARGDFFLPRPDAKLLDFLVRTLVNKRNWK